MKFLTKEQLLEVQTESINRFGGSHGVRDEGAFESAVHAAENRHFYEGADEIACAATYAFHLSQAHAFIDGNKRVAAGAALIFLDLNGFELEVPTETLIEIFLRLAAGELSRENLEALFREHVKQA